MLFYLANTMLAKVLNLALQKQLRITTDLMEIVMTIVVAASTQLSGQLAKLIVARSKTRHSRTERPMHGTRVSSEVGCGCMSYHLLGELKISCFRNPFLNDRMTDKITIYPSRACVLRVNNIKQLGEFFS